MNAIKQGNVLVCTLLLGMGVSSCSQTTTLPEQPTVTISDSAPSSKGDARDSGGRLTDTRLSQDAPINRALREAPEAQLNPPKVKIIKGSYIEEAADLTATYWSSDWCHYYVGNDGETYGDTCVRASVTADGTALQNQFSIYRYDPDRPDNLGNLVFELYTGYPEFTTYRDLTDPLFNQVQWAAFPTGIADLTPATFMVSFLDNNGQLVWYTTQQIIDMAASARADANIPTSTVPAWDPAITVWTYPMLSSINSRLASIPSASY